ncbi:hypothetical protein NDU88_002420 [Pleurodeles waltl]|uniref:Uncharacterized protein n=1 Tax=Pleurodeles waltl TaxID=8319 RepID=A0AAV7LFV9_PLEWA|nr:hypothetical protein NDU88_002420 [Pleurodeles waltl]
MARPGASRRRTIWAPRAPLGVSAAPPYAWRPPVLLFCSGLVEPPTTLTLLESPSQLPAGRRHLRHFLGALGGLIQPHAGAHRNFSPQLLVAGQAAGSSRCQRGPDLHIRARKGLRGSPASSLGHLLQC